MVPWGELARSIAIDLSKLLVSWVVEINRQRPIHSGADITWACAKQRSWLERELDECKGLAGRAVICEQAAGKAAAADRYLVALAFLVGTVFGGIVVALLCNLFKGSAVVRGEPVSLALNEIEKKAPATQRDELGRQELAAARSRARQISRRSRSLALAWDSSMSSGGPVHSSDS